MTRIAWTRINIFKRNSGCKSRLETIETTSKDITENDQTRSQSPIELTLDNEHLFKYRSFFFY